MQLTGGQMAVLVMPGLKSWSSGIGRCGHGRLGRPVSVLRIAGPGVDDILHADGSYVAEQVARDNNLITSRLPSEVGWGCHSLPSPSSKPSHEKRARLAPKTVGTASPDYTQVSGLVGV